MAAAASFSLSLARGGRGYPPRAKHQLHGAGLRRPKAPARPGINGKLSSGAPEREDALSGGTSSEQRAVVASHTSASTSPSPLLPSPVGQSIGSGEVDELLVGIIRDSPRQSQLCEGCKRLGRKLMGTRNVRRVAPTVLPQHAFEGTNYILKKGVLTVICPDSAGIIGTVTSFLHMHGANIMDCQTNSTPGNIFTMRVEFCIPDRWLGVVREAFSVMIAEPYDMQWRIRWADEKKKMAVLCTKEDHALMEMLWATVREDLNCTITTVISNHTDLKKATESLGFTFHHVPVEKGKKEQAEEEILQLLGDADVAVLARYMQVLSSDFIDRAGIPIINIHHSFLPAFKGANPYRQAHDKGVRLIGATGHYVTAELDQGPIIEQDVARVNHRMSVQDFRAMGRSVECKVLHRAVKWHLEDRVFVVENNKTVVFS